MIVCDGETGVQTVTFLGDGDPYAVAWQSAGPTAGTLKIAPCGSKRAPKPRMR